jgi:hypothetical protein
LVHFIPGKFERPENLSPGAIKFLDLMKEATGIEMKPRCLQNKATCQLNYYSEGQDNTTEIDA